MKYKVYNIRFRDLAFSMKNMKKIMTIEGNI